MHRHPFAFDTKNNLAAAIHAERLTHRLGHGGLPLRGDRARFFDDPGHACPRLSPAGVRKTPYTVKPRNEQRVLGADRDEMRSSPENWRLTPAPDRSSGADRYHSALGHRFLPPRSAG